MSEVGGDGGQSGRGQGTGPHRRAHHRDSGADAGAGRSGREKGAAPLDGKEHRGLRPLSISTRRRKFARPWSKPHPRCSKRKRPASPIRRRRRRSRNRSRISRRPSPASRRIPRSPRTAWTRFRNRRQRRRKRANWRTTGSNITNSAAASPDRNRARVGRDHHRHLRSHLAQRRPRRDRRDPARLRLFRADRAGLYRVDRSLLPFTGEGGPKRRMRVFVAARRGPASTSRAAAAADRLARTRRERQQRVTARPARGRRSGFDAVAP